MKSDHKLLLDLVRRELLRCPIIHRKKCNKINEL
jgi:hypothetical protein